MTSKRLGSHVALPKAEKFLLACIRHGLAHSLVRHEAKEIWIKSYPEVTGYILSYFCSQDRWEEESLKAAVAKLLSLQHPSGGFPSFYDQHLLYSFDTAQIMHGLLSWHQQTGDTQALTAAIRAGDFLCAMQLPSGVIFPIYDTKRQERVVYQNNAKGSNWGSHFSYIQVKNAEGLQLLARMTGKQKYQTSAERLAHIVLTAVDYHYTHPLAYYLEGMLALGKRNEVKQILQQKIIPRIKPSGFIAYFPGAAYAYVSGSVQLAILLSKTGFTHEARAILSWARKVQEQDVSGGLFQYAQADGRPDSTIHQEINSWGTKYFAELLRLVN